MGPVPKNATLQRLLIAGLFSLGLLCAMAASAGDFVPGEVLVKFRDEASVLGVSQALVGRPGHVPVTAGVSRVPIRPGETVEQVVLELEALAEVEYAEPNYLSWIQRTPDDPHFPHQWGLRNTGQTVNVTPIGDQPGTPGLDIGATRAWDTTIGSRDVVVAVIDTGIDLNNLEFIGNLWRGPDGVRGHDFVDNDRTPQDTHGHGTSIAGVIGARGDNGRGIAGTAWEVTMMAVRTFDSRGAATVGRIAAAVDYARQNGAHIINASFGATRSAPSQTEFEAFRRAGDAGILVIAAACNDGADNDAGGQGGPCYPASYDLPNIISVAATDNTDALIAASNYGLRSVDLGAPGAGILSLRIQDPGSDETPLVHDSGTSIAAAFVTGAAVLLLAHNPGLTVEELRAALLENVDPAPNLQGRVATGGRLNVAEALASVPAGTQSIGPRPAPAAASSGGGALDRYVLLFLALCYGARRLRCPPVS